MAFRQVTTQALDIKTKKGEAFLGTYTGNTKIQTKMGEQTIWQFLDDDGLPFGIYGFTNLNRAMQTIPTGKMCRITYRGTIFMKTKFKPTGQDVHQVQVEVDDGEPNGNGDPVPPARATFANGDVVPEDE